MKELEAEIVDSGSAVAVRVPALEMLTPVMDLKLAKSRLKEFQEFIAGYLVEGLDQDYGVIPGTKNKTLLQPGADKLNEIYGLVPHLIIESKVENWESGLFDYTILCNLMRGDRIAGSGLGSASSWETKHRFRRGERRCPSCDQPQIIKGKEEYGGGWLCWTKKGGCGEKFTEKDPRIVNQEVGLVENANLVDVKNTVLKIAVKRAKVAATIAATRSSGIFTQDIEDLVQTEEPQPEPKPEAPAAKESVNSRTQPPPPPPAQPRTQAPPPPPATGPVKTISPAQVKRFSAIARSNRWSEEQIHRMLLKTARIDHRDHIPASLYTNIVDNILMIGPEEAGYGKAAQI